MRILTKIFEFCSVIIRKLFGFTCALLACTFGVLVILYVFVEHLPLGNPSANLLSFARNPPKNLLDMHVHVAGLGSGSNCFIAPELVKSWKYWFYLRGFDVTQEELQKFGDAHIVKKISEKVSRSKFTSKAVVLALDGIINDQGKLAKSHTQVYVPDEFVSQEVKKYDNLLYGASINPYRKDAIARLEKAKNQGAVLVKWIPSIMRIDPADDQLIPFYRKMVELELPLLTHTGQERSFKHANDELADPIRLTLPLKLGVKVIAAHIATTGEVQGVDNFKRIIPMFSENNNLYTDISSLTQINKLNYLDAAIKEPAVLKRMLNGSDWPLQFFPLVSPWYHINNISLADARFVHQVENVFDRDTLLKVSLGVPREVFKRSASLLRTHGKAVQEATLNAPAAE